MSAAPARRGSTAEWLRRDAERIGGSLPPLLAEAERLAHTVASGLHGRRRAGPGESFWQFRHAVPGDAAEQIDWRQSARSDALYIREMEWETAQSVQIWADDALAMQYRSDAAQRTKAERAALLALALAVLLVRAGERVGLMGTPAGPITARRPTTRWCAAGGSCSCRTSWAPPTPCSPPSSAPPRRA